MNPPTTTTIAYVKGFGCDVRHKTRALLRELRASLRDGGAAGGSPPYTPNRLSKLTLDSCLSKGRRTASFERCRSQADRAKTPRHFQPCPIFAAYDRAEEKKSRKSALRTTVRSFPSSFRTVCKVFGTARWDHGVRLAPSDLLGLIERTLDAPTPSGFLIPPNSQFRQLSSSGSTAGASSRPQDRTRSS